MCIQLSHLWTSVHRWGCRWAIRREPGLSLEANLHVYRICIACKLMHIFIQFHLITMDWSISNWIRFDWSKLNSLIFNWLLAWKLWKKCLIVFARSLVCCYWKLEVVCVLLLHLFFLYSKVDVWVVLLEHFLWGRPWPGRLWTSVRRGACWQAATWAVRGPYGMRNIIVYSFESF